MILYLFYPSLSRSVRARVLDYIHDFELPLAFFGVWGGRRRVNFFCYSCDTYTVIHVDKSHRHETKTAPIGTARFADVFEPETEFRAVRDDAFIGDEIVASCLGGV